MSKPGVTIIIKKIKKGHGGHHGGAWKIAYADFVTAMMAFFLLLWLLSNTPKETLDGISQYFAPTIGVAGGKGIGIKGGTSESNDKGNNKGNRGSQSITLGAPSASNLMAKKSADSTELEVDNREGQNFTNLKTDLYKAVKDAEESKPVSENVKIDVTPEGLRIQIHDDEERAMFEKNGDRLMPYAETVLKIIADYVKYMPNYIAVEGHTSASEGGAGSNIWEISVNRGLIVRKFLLANGLDKEQIYRVSGKADQEPANSDNPYSPVNNRISIVLLKDSIVPYQKRSIPEGQ